jgi:curved DNA-binding protein CbpA
MEYDFIQLSLLIHPDKNANDRDRADAAFDSKF